MTTERESKRILTTDGIKSAYPCAECGKGGPCEHGNPAFYKQPSKRILSVTIKRIADYDADTSDLGEYSDTPNDYAIVAVGQYEGKFVSDLPCECSHVLFEHGEDDASEQDCRFADCTCEAFEQVSIKRGRDYRYFNAPIENYQGESEADIRKYAQQDYKRMRDLDRGEWGFIGIKAEAAIAIPNGNDASHSSLIQTIHSGGLWGVESDAGESDFKEIEDEELSELRDQLHAVGFSKRAIVAAFRNVQHSEVN